MPPPFQVHSSALALSVFKSGSEDLSTNKTLYSLIKLFIKSQRMDVLNTTPEM